MTDIVNLVIRDSRPDDEPFVLATAERLAAFEFPGWRTSQEIVAGELRTLRRFFAGSLPGSALLVAAASPDDGLGFVLLETVRDYFSDTEHAHVGMLAVVESAEGRRVGRALLEAAERWARTRGFSRLSLNVFDHNTRARSLYERLGYSPETVRYVKVLA
ncbi:MAG: GNAT family N-acetyltransferase [Thermoanaerobaculia bacterium]|jgi:GNAT superfamily N-acetyltransferase